jgi:hypothetical protein
LLTTLLGMHTMARRHCEAARRQQARVTAGVHPSTIARAPGPKSLGQTTPHRYDMRQRAVPPGTGRCQKGAALAVFIPLPKLAERMKACIGSHCEIVYKPNWVTVDCGSLRESAEESIHRRCAHCEATHGSVTA